MSIHIILKIFRGQHGYLARHSWGTKLKNDGHSGGIKLLEAQLRQKQLGTVEAQLWHNLRTDERKVSLE